MYEILIGLPIAFVLVILFFAVLVLADKFITKDNFYIIFSLLCFLILSFIVGSAVTHAETKYDPESPFCKELGKMIDNATDMDYNELNDLQERFSNDCEEN